MGFKFRITNIEHYKLVIFMFCNIRVDACQILHNGIHRQFIFTNWNLC